MSSYSNNCFCEHMRRWFSHSTRCLNFMAFDHYYLIKHSGNELESKNSYTSEMY